MAINPQTGLDEDDPEVQAMLQQQARDRAGQTHDPAPLPPSPNDLVAMNIKSQLDKPPDMGVMGVDRSSPPLAPPEVPAPAGAPLAPTLPQQKKEITATDSSTTSVRKVVTPEERKLEAEKAKTATEQEGLLRQEGQVSGQIAGLHEEAAKKKVELSQQYGEQLKQVTADANAEMQRRQAAYDDAQKAYAQAKPTDFWADDPGGSRKFWAGIAMALGGWNAATTGRNLAADQINTAIEQHDRRERERIDRLEKVAVAKKGDIADARQRKIDSLQDLSAWKAQAYDEAANQIEAKLAALGKPEAEIKTNESIVANRQRAQEERQRWFDSTRSEIHSTVTKRTQEILAEGAGVGAGSAKGITDARQRAAIATGLRDQMGIVDDEAKKGVRLTDKDLQRWQDNETYLKMGEHDPGKLLLLRKLGAAPRTKYDGIDEKKHRMIGAMNLATQKGALLNAGSMTVEGLAHGRELVDLMVPGLGPEERRRRMEYIMRDAVGVQEGLVPEQVRQATAGANAAMGKTAAAAPARSDLLQQAARLKQLLDKYPNDPRAGEARSRYNQLVGQLGGG